MLTVLASCGGSGGSVATSTKTSTVLNGVEVSTFMYQLQGLFETESVDLLDATEYDMLVVEPIIDALATEDTWFYGEGDVPWDDANAGDLTGGDRPTGDFSAANRIIQNKKYLALDIPVFTVDYCISENNAEQVYRDSRDNGFIPLVTRVSLSEITETPPF